jgi:hypothetical protein
MSTVLARVRKFLIALAGLAAIGITQGLIEGSAADWCAAGIAALTAAGVYVVPNRPAETVPAPDVEVS